MGLISTRKLRKQLKNVQKDIHTRLKPVRRIWSRLGQTSSPVRYIRRYAYPISHPMQVLARARAAKNLTREMDEEVAAAARELSSTGFVDVTKIVETALLSELDEFYREVLDPRSADAQAVATHPFFYYLGKPSDLVTDNISVRFMLQERILKVVAATFGSMPVIRGVGVNESRGLESKEWLASQLWHLDYYAESRSVNFWVYFTDVPTLAQGPFTFLPLKESSLIKNDFLPRRIRDEEITQLGLDPKVKRVFGSRLTCFLIQSADCYHMGSRLEYGQRRVAYIGHYVTPASRLNAVKVTTPLPKEHELIVSS